MIHQQAERAVGLAVLLALALGAPDGAAAASVVRSRLLAVPVPVHAEAGASAAHSEHPAHSDRPEHSEAACGGPTGTRHFRVTRDGLLAVADGPGRRIVLFGPDGAFAGTVGAAGEEAFDAIGDFCVLDDGSVLFIQEHDQALVRVARSGEILAYWVPPPELPVENITLLETTIDDRIVIGDAGLRKLHILDRNFGHLHSIPWGVNGLAISRRGSLVLLEEEGDACAIVSYDRDFRRRVHGTLAREFDTYCMLDAVTTDGLLLITTIEPAHGRGVLRWMTRTGEVRESVKLPRIPSARPVRLSADGRVHVLLPPAAADGAGKVAVLEVGSRRRSFRSSGGSSR